MSGFGVLWPWGLALLLLAPFALLLYRRGLGGRSRSHAAYPDAALVAVAARKSRPWRHLPAVLYAGALAAGLLALARPTATMLLPDDLAGVMLAIETSSSMNARDIAPSRLEATRIAAKALLETIPAGTKVGLATFSGYGALNVPPTLDHARVAEAIDALSLGGGYAFSFGLLASLDALPDEAEGGAGGAIVLFSHGHDNSGNDPLAIADEAALRGIRIHTIGVGTHGNNFSEDVLEIVADRSGGRYYPIYSASDLRDAHRDLGRVIVLRRRPVEVTALAALAAALLLLASLAATELRRRVL